MIFENLEETATDHGIFDPAETLTILDALMNIVADSYEAFAGI